MPEKFTLPEIKGRPKKNEKDVTKGEITEKGVWKSEELINSEGNASSASPQRLREFIPEEVPLDQNEKNVGKIDEDIESVGHKSSNIEPTKADNFYIKPSVHTRTRQELIKSGRKKTRRVQRKITSQEPDMYEALFNR